MITNLDQAIKHHKDFYDSFINLKVVGWRSYSKALNAYTFSFFKAQLDLADSAVDNLANIMKGNTNVK